MTDQAQTYRYKSVQIPLQEPIILDGQSVTHLSMRPPKAIDVINACDLAPSKNQEDALLFANLCEIPLQVVLMMPYYDYKLLEAAYDRFLYPAQLHCEMESLPLSAALEVLTHSNLPSSTRPS